jgi:hypothetical protein
VTTTQVPSGTIVFSQVCPCGTGGDLSQYGVVPSESEITEYFKKLASITVNQPGGPFTPLTLYTFQNPVRSAITNGFVVNSSLTSVTDYEKFTYSVVNHPSASVKITQVGLKHSTDLSTIRAAALPSVATSDQGDYRVHVYDASSDTVSVLAVDPACNRFQQEPLLFPNGAWEGQRLTAGEKPLTNFYSPLPWEQSLHSLALRVTNETVAYEDLPATVRSVVISRHNYLFMDPGTSWLEEDAGTCTVGERAPSLIWITA